MSSFTTILMQNGLQKTADFSQARTLAEQAVSRLQTASTDILALGSQYQEREGDIVATASEAVEAICDTIVLALMTLSQLGLDAELTTKLAMNAEAERKDFPFPDLLRSSYAVLLGTSYHAQLGLFVPGK